MLFARSHRLFFPIITTHEPSTLSFDTSTMAEPKLYKCGFCDEWSGQSEHATRAHMLGKHNICWSAAIPCTQKFGSRRELTKHWIQTSHCYYYYICDGGYQSKDLFAEHACTPRKDAIIGGIKCPVCQMMAPTQEAYDRHFEDAAQDSRHFRCAECHRIFTEENALRMVCPTTSYSQQYG